MAVDDLRQNKMMTHLLESLEDGKDIGHYGRLVFTMVARHFVSNDELVDLLAQDKDEDKDEARGLVQQVEDADYSPPSRDTILGYHKQQDFPILPDADDPDVGNVYQDLTFPDHVYESIAEYREQKAS